MLVAGETVKLFVKKSKLFVKKRKKNDAADAAAICEAASRPDVKFVAVKSVEQQGILALHVARSLLVEQQTMLPDAMHGLATEFGLTVPKGIRKLKEHMALVDANETIPSKPLRRSVLRRTGTSAAFTPAIEKRASTYPSRCG